MQAPSATRAGLLASLLLSSWLLTLAVAAWEVQASEVKAWKVQASEVREDKSVLIVGSLNVDITIQVTRLPRKDETITAASPLSSMAMGGKGANQAVAVARLAGSTVKSLFMGQFGNDAHAAMLERVLKQNNVNLSLSGRSEDLPSGQGYVFLEPDGSVGSVVVGGANTRWPSLLGVIKLLRATPCTVRAVLLQREIPERVNQAVAEEANWAGIPVFQDVGGEDRSMSENMLKLMTYVMPNESELSRLTGMPVGDTESVVKAAKWLQEQGARNVLVTLGARGSLLLTETGELLHQEATPVPGGVVVDATGAGDSFRAAFTVCVTEQQHTLQECMLFGSVAGALAVTKAGAEPSLPRWGECLPHLPPEWPRGTWAKAKEEDASSGETASPQTCSLSSGAAACGLTTEGIKGVETLRFASRLNSMKARADLWDATLDVAGLVKRQKTVEGLGLVDFNYPQHLEGMEPQAVVNMLNEAKLQAGAVCIRFPDSMQQGAFTNPDPALREAAVNLTMEGCQWAKELGAQELIVWSAYDGYDYHLQVNYKAAWQRIVESFQAVCDACRELKVSMEPKPTDENTRFSIVATTGEALMLVKQVDRSNMGLTLDVGHLLMAGENPAQSVALVGSAGKLFGLQLSDAHSRLGAEDGLVFGSVHPRMALELVYWLQKTRYQGHIYFDTFPRNEDPVREAEMNIKMFKSLWVKAEHVHEMEELLDVHDAMSVMERLVDLGL